MLAFFASAFLLGLIFNAAPGAVFAETVKEGARGGFKPALAVQLGSLAGDALWAVLGLSGVGILLQADWLRVPVGIAGVAYLLWLAWDAWRAAGRHLGTRTHDAASHRSALRSGALLSLTNPQNVAYWAAIGSAMGALGVHQPDSTHYTVFFAAFMTSSVLWCFIAATLVDRLFRRANTQWATLTYRLCAVALLALAIGSMRDLMAPVAKADRPVTPPAVPGRP
jgi:chemosensory pili system protein ChpE/L-lysine exporter family protein LysE/ArgO